MTKFALEDLKSQSRAAIPATTRFLVRKLNVYFGQLHLIIISGVCMLSTRSLKSSLLKPKAGTRFS